MTITKEKKNLIKERCSNPGGDVQPDRRAEKKMEVKKTKKVLH